MARPQIFNQQLVVAKAIECFWRKGYSATSLADLLQAMNISRSSFYNSFGDKRQLFEMCLQGYGQQLERILAMTLLNDKLTGLQAIKAFLQLVLSTSDRDLAAKGCLLVNTIAETASVDSGLNEKAAQLILPIKLGFIYQLEKEFDQDVSLRNGEWLFTQLLGWRLQAQMGMSELLLQQQIDWSLLQIEQQPKKEAVC
jgi:TetR/AcrR family transcriptional repressor of nem operon